MSWKLRFIERWNWLRFNVLRWSVISGLMKYRISQAASIIPVAGYAILWSEKFDGLLKYQKAWDAAAWFTVSERLHMIYFGSISLTIALAIFYIFCPHIIRRQPTIEGYILEQIQTESKVVKQRRVNEGKILLNCVPNVPIFNKDAGYILKREMRDDLHKKMGDISDGMTNIEACRIVYLHHEDRILPAIIFTYIFLIAGVIPFFLPSVEVFYLVIVS